MWASVKERGRGKERNSAFTNTNTHIHKHKHIRTRCEAKQSRSGDGVRLEERLVASKADAGEPLADVCERPLGHLRDIALLHRCRQINACRDGVRKPPPTPELAVVKQPKGQS